MTVCWLRGTGVCEGKAAGPYKFIGFGAIDISKPYKFIWLGDIDSPKAYEFMGSGGFYFANTDISCVQIPRRSILESRLHVVVSTFVFLLIWPPLKDELS